MAKFILNGSHDDNRADLTVSGRGVKTPQEPT